MWSAVLDLHRDFYAILSRELRAEEVTPVLVVAGLALGAVHALTPGHGKIFIFSYLIGREARLLQGLGIAVRLVATHFGVTLALFALLRLLVIGVFGPATRGVPAMEIASAGGVIAAGLLMLGQLASGRRHAGSPLLPYAAGLVPCPITLMVLSITTGRESAIPGAIVITALAAGVLATISLVALAGMALRERAVALLTRFGAGLGLCSRGLALSSAAALLIAGGVMMAQAVGRL